MQMTFHQYITNPLGKKAAVFSQRDMYNKLYTDKYGAILLRENGTFETHFYVDKQNDRYFCYMKVPSEVVEKFYYDVVIEFFPIDATNATANTLDNYGVRFFSNDPAFVFVYEYVFNENDMFIAELKSRASKQALRSKPDEKNPYRTPGYVKSIYFCYLHMKYRGLFNKTYWKQYGEKFNIRSLINQITPSDKKIADRQRLGAEVAEKKAKEEKTQKRNQTANAQKQATTIKKPKGGIRVVQPVRPIKKKPNQHVNVKK